MLLITAGLSCGWIGTAIFQKMRLGTAPGFALVILASATWASIRPLPIKPELLGEAATLALLPILHTCGLGLGRQLRDGGWIGDALQGALHVAIKTFFVGGLAFFLIPFLIPWNWIGSPLSPYLLSFAVGALVSIAEPWPVFHQAGPPIVREPRSQAQAHWGAFIGLACWLVFQRELSRPGAFTTPGLWILLLEPLVKEAGAGLCAGIFGGLLTKFFHGSIPVHWITGLAALCLSRYLDEKGLLAMLVSGACHAGLSASFSPPGSGSRQLQDLDGGSLEWRLLGGLVLSIATGAAFPELVREVPLFTLSALWLWGLLAAGLLALTAGGLFSRSRPSTGRRWQEALCSLNFYPGVLACGSALALGFPDEFPKKIGSFSVQAMLLSLTVQGAMSTWIGERKKSIDNAGWLAWQTIEGRWLALKSFQATLARLERDLSEAAFQSMRRALESALQSAQLERQAFLARI